jgi:glycosyltransferase involved in cell wall biosynthesis
MINYSFVIITPAHNEEAFIKKTIESVISQTVLPTKWVIVNDGSTDRTDQIITSYLADYNWIELVHMPKHRDRTFAAKVQAFNAGLKRVNDLKYKVIGNLDADISFEKDYFKFLLSKFKEDERLGVCGTPFIEDGKHYDYRFTNIEHVSGACQMFRRECFEEIGGYVPIKGGGIDWTAVTTARMKGWKTRTFTEKKCIHHRKIGTGNNKILINELKQGQKDYYLGGHPVWQIFRSFYQMTRRPFIIRGLLILTGYLLAYLIRIKKPIPSKLVEFHRREQIDRLKIGLREKLR